MGFLKRLYHADDLVIAQIFVCAEGYMILQMICLPIARVDSMLNLLKARLWLEQKKLVGNVGHGVMRYGGTRRYTG